jgi:hypothetical protein
LVELSLDLLTDAELADDADDPPAADDATRLSASAGSDTAPSSNVAETAHFLIAFMDTPMWFALSRPSLPRAQEYPITARFASPWRGPTMRLARARHPPTNGLT